jgi:hypothetical protein
MMDGYVPPAAAGRLGDPSGERVGPPSEMDPSPFPKKKMDPSPRSQSASQCETSAAGTAKQMVKYCSLSRPLSVFVLPSANPASVREMIVYFVYLRQRHRTSNKTVLQKSKWNRELSQQ